MLLNTRRSFLCALVVVATGCVAPVPPPPMSAAKFVHTAGDRSRLGFSTGIGATVDSDENMTITAFPAEGGLGVSFGPRYDLAFSVGNLLANVGGNVILIDSGFKLGFLHELGLGLLADRQAGSLLTQVGGGLMFQTASDEPFFLAAKYDYATAIGDTEGWSPTHYVTTTFGFMPGGHPRVIPEFAVNYAKIGGEDPDPSWDLSFVVGVTIMTDMGEEPAEAPAAPPVTDGP